MVDRSQGRVTKLTPDGRFVTRFGGVGTAPGSLSKARRCAFADGKLYSADAGNHRIEVFGPSGEVFPPIVGNKKPGAPMLTVVTPLLEIVPVPAARLRLKSTGLCRPNSTPISC